MSILAVTPPDYPSINLYKLEWFTKYTADQITHVGRPVLTMEMIIGAVDDQLFELEEKDRKVLLGQAFVAGRVDGLQIQSFGFERVGRILENLTRSVIYSMVAFEIVRNGYILVGQGFRRLPILSQTA